MELITNNKWFIAAMAQFVIQSWFWSIFTHVALPDGPLMLHWFGFPMMITVILSMAGGFFYCMARQSDADDARRNSNKTN